VHPPRGGAGANEEEVVGVFRHVEAVGAVVDVKRAVAVEEAASPRVTVAEDPEEHLDFDEGEVIPVVLGKRYGAAGLLEHPVDGTNTEALIEPPTQLTSVRCVAEAKAGSLVRRVARSAAAAELRRSRRGSTNSPVRSASSTEMAGSTQWEKRAGSTAASGPAVFQLSSQNEVESPAPTLMMVSPR
jgi:hypothetical protein